MRHRILMTTLCAAALAVPVGASSTTASGQDRVTGSLALNAALVAGYEFGFNWCPAGTPATTEDCVHFVGVGAVPGLGHVTETYTKSFDQSICPDQVTSHPNVLFEVAGKGEIEVSMNPWPSCADPAASSPTGVTSLLEGTVTRGTGKFAGASGSLKVSNHVSPPSSCASGCRGSAEDVWTGTLVVPGMEFDLTPPVLSGARSKTVKAPRKAKFARVRYAVKAQDAVDGAVPVTCKPASGSRFKVGRTKVTCVAEDTSANAATTQFTVTVKRKGRALARGGAVAPTAGDTATGTFALNADFGGLIRPVACPAGIAATTGCYENSGRAGIPGLGRVSMSFLLLLDRAVASCPRMSTAISFLVEQKGAIQMSARSPGCTSDTPLATDSYALEFTVVEGTGSYAGAAGGGTLEVRYVPTSSPLTVSFRWAGALQVAGLEFDLGPPDLSGATSRTVKMPKKAKKAKRLRVSYTVTAHDAVDGSVAVTCRPRSGTFFKVGRTKVTCVAEDTSANVATNQFTVTVKRTRGGSQ